MSRQFATSHSEDRAKLHAHGRALRWPTAISSREACRCSIPLMEHGKKKLTATVAWHSMYVHTLVPFCRWKRCEGEGGGGGRNSLQAVCCKGLLQCLQEGHIRHALGICIWHTVGSSGICSSRLPPCGPAGLCPAERLRRL